MNKYSTNLKLSILRFIIIGLGLLPGPALFGVGTPVFIGPTPGAPLAGIMDNGLFAEKLIRKRRSLSISRGSPAMMLGGNFELVVGKESSAQKGFEINPKINSTAINGVIFFDQWVIGSFLIRQGEVERALRRRVLLKEKEKEKEEENRKQRKEIKPTIEKFALIIGNAASYQGYTKIAGINLPVGLYAVLGKFNAPFITYLSEGLFPSYTEEEATYQSKGLSIGAHKEFGIYSIHGILFIPTKRNKITDFNINLKVYQPSFDVTLGGSYTNNYLNYLANKNYDERRLNRNDKYKFEKSVTGVHATINRGAFKFQLESIWRQELSQAVMHGEIIWQGTVSQWPLGVIVGCSKDGRSKKEYPNKRAAYTWFATVKTKISAYSTFGIGIASPSNVSAWRSLIQFDFSF